MDSAPLFLFVTCQVGAEAALKGELARGPSPLRLAFSRPGFLTFKLPPEHPFDQQRGLRSVFARAYGLSMGRVQSDGPAAMAAMVWEQLGSRRFDRLHVWQRDTASPGHGFHPSITDSAREAEAALLAAAPVLSASTSEEPDASEPAGAIAVGPARRGELVLDVIVVEPDLWWIGSHRARGTASLWPGGLPPLELPAEAVSRAYLKMEEALLWSRLPLEAGQRIAEIGSAPGGSSQALLKRGLLVTGIDPAAMHADVLANPNFQHLRKRGAEVRRREFRKIRWLTADLNVAPQYTLDTVESIATHPEVKIRGLLLTLKLLEWSLADEIPAYLERIRSWGFAEVRARQLAHNRQEICVSALRQRRKAVRKPGGRVRRGLQADMGDRSSNLNDALAREEIDNS